MRHIMKNEYIKRIKIISGWLIMSVSSLFIIYGLWLIIGSTIYAFKVGPNSGSGLGQMFGFVISIISAGSFLVGYFLKKGEL